MKKVTTVTKGGGKDQRIRSRMKVIRENGEEDSTAASSSSVSLNMRKKNRKSFDVGQPVPDTKDKTVSKKVIGTYRGLGTDMNDYSTSELRILTAKLASTLEKGRPQFYPLKFSADDNIQVYVSKKEGETTRIVVPGSAKQKEEHKKGSSIGLVKLKINNRLVDNILEEEDDEIKSLSENESIGKNRKHLISIGGPAYVKLLKQLVEKYKLGEGDKFKNEAIRILKIGFTYGLSNTCLMYGVKWVGMNDEILPSFELRSDNELFQFLSKDNGTNLTNNKAKIPAIYHAIKEEYDEHLFNPDNVSRGLYGKVKEILLHLDNFIDKKTGKSPIADDVIEHYQQTQSLEDRFQYKSGKKSQKTRAGQTAFPPVKKNKDFTPAPKDSDSYCSIGYSGPGVAGYSGPGGQFGFRNNMVKKRVLKRNSKGEIVYKKIPQKIVNRKTGQTELKWIDTPVYETYYTCAPSSYSYNPDSKSGQTKGKDLRTSTLPTKANKALYSMSLNEVLRERIETGKLTNDDYEEYLNQRKQNLNEEGTYPKKVRIIKKQYIDPRTNKLAHYSKKKSTPTTTDNGGSGDDDLRKKKTTSVYSHDDDSSSLRYKPGENLRRRLKKEESSNEYVLSESLNSSTSTKSNKTRKSSKEKKIVVNKRKSK